MTSRKHIHKATENPWKSKNVTLSAYLQEVTSCPLNSVPMSCAACHKETKLPVHLATLSVFKQVQSLDTLCITHV